MDSTPRFHCSPERTASGERAADRYADGTCVGVDVGGTFTDVALVGAGTIVLDKSPTTRHDPSVAVVAGLDAVDPESSIDVAHGTTIATNALLERRGARTAFLTTSGFSDLLALGRGHRAELYNLFPSERVSIVPPELCLEVDERVGAEGRVVQPLSETDALRAIDALRDAGAESVAVCLLFSYLSPEHERTLGSAIEAALPDVHVSLSVDVLPEFREYERASTTVVNAYVAPRVSAYLSSLEAALAPRALTVMGSHAGCLPTATASRLAVTTVLSGPAAGVVGALAMAERAGASRIITFDMGGTSTDVALCDGAVPFTNTTTVAGLPVHRAGVDVHTVGAGGGSIVRADPAGALLVGPESAGADPGPAAYGRGGRMPTVTDAHVVLGRLPSDCALAGGLLLDVRAASDAMGAVAQPLGLDARSAALGAVSIANAAMERALRRVSVERGFDPREFALVAFGGAGPLHACELADAIGVTEVLVPQATGALSALGLATAPPVASASRSILRPKGAAPVDIPSSYVELESEALGLMGGVTPDVVHRLADLRYEGQSWEITVPWPTDGDFAETFQTAHARRYGYSRPGTPVEIVTLRVRAEGRPRAALPPPDLRTESVERRTTLVTSDGNSVAAAVIGRSGMVPGQGVAGPAIVTQYDATTYVAPGWCATVEAWGDLLLRRSDR